LSFQSQKGKGGKGKGGKGKGGKGKGGYDDDSYGVSRPLGANFLDKPPMVKFSLMFASFLVQKGKGGKGKGGKGGKGGMGMMGGKGKGKGGYDDDGY
jgi:hypothetical protein